MIHYTDSQVSPLRRRVVRILAAILFPLFVVAVLFVDYVLEHDTVLRDELKLIREDKPPMTRRYYGW